jgi:hypothetical protein
MLYILSCVATRTKGLIFRTVECESFVDLTMAENEAEAMERLRGQAEARYDVDIKKRNAWNVELHVAEVPVVACLIVATYELARRMAAAKNDEAVNACGGDCGDRDCDACGGKIDVNDDAASADATKESTDGQEEPVEAGKQEGGIDAQPEA